MYIAWNLHCRWARRKGAYYFANIISMLLKISHKRFFDSAVYDVMANGDIRLQSPLPYFRAHGTVREPYDDVGRFQERIMGLSSPSVCVTCVCMCVEKAQTTVGQLRLSRLQADVRESRFRTKAPTLNKNNPVEYCKHLCDLKKKIAFVKSYLEFFHTHFPASSEYIIASLYYPIDR